MSDLKSEILEMGKKARAAAHELAKLTADEKNAILLAMAEAIVANEAAILEANAKDIAAAEESGLTSAMIDRGTWTSTPGETWTV